MSACRITDDATVVLDVDSGARTPTSLSQSCGNGDNAGCMRLADSEPQFRDSVDITDLLAELDDFIRQNFDADGITADDKTRAAKVCANGTPQYSEFSCSSAASHSTQVPESATKPILATVRRKPACRVTFRDAHSWPSSTGSGSAAIGETGNRSTAAWDDVTTVDVGNYVGKFPARKSSVTSLEQRQNGTPRANKDSETIPPRRDVTRECPSRDRSHNDDVIKYVSEMTPITQEFAPHRTISLLAAWALMGVLTALPSASLNEWRQHYSATYEQLSRTFAVDGVGVVLGALLSTGSMCCRDSSSGDGMIGVAMVMMMTYPCFHSIDYLLASSLVFGVGKGLLLVGGIWLIFRLWGDVTARAGVFVQLLYIANAVGSFAGLHLAAPYLRHVFRFIGSSDGCLATTSSPRDVTSNASFDTTDFSLNVTASPPTAVNYTGKTGFVCFTTEKRFPLLYTPVMSFNLLLAVFFFLCSFRFCFEARKLCRREATRSRRKRKKCVRKARTSAVDNNYTSTDLPPTILDFKRSDQILHIAEVQETSKTREDGTGVEWIGDDVDEYAEVDEPSKRNQKIVFNEVSMLKVSQSDDGGSSPEKKFTRPIRSWFRDGQKFDVPVLMFFYVYFFLPHGVETMIGRFVGVYADRSRTLHESAPLDPRQLLLSVFWASVILGRLLTVAASRFLPATWLTVIFITLQLTASTAVFIYGDRSEVVLWLFVAVYGCVLGPVLPGGLTWCNAFLDQSTARPHALAVSAAGLGGALMSWLGGIVVDYVGARWLWAVASAVAAISGILSVPVVTSLESARVRRRHQRRPRSTYV